MSTEYNALEQGNQQTEEGMTGGNKKFKDNDIRHNTFNLGNMHLGTTGADNDNQTKADGERLFEMVLKAPERKDFEGVGEGQQEPFNGKSNNK